MFCQNIKETTRRFAAAAVVVLAVTEMALAADYPLSLQLEELERDLTSADYQAVLGKMIPIVSDTVHFSAAVSRACPSPALVTNIQSEDDAR